MSASPREQFEISITTAAGQVETAVDVPTAFVPVTAITPLLRRLGEEAQRLEEVQASQKGRFRSCAQGCAACCRMLVPLSPPEAFGLMDFVRRLTAEQQDRLRARFEEAKSMLVAQGLWQPLLDVAEAERPLKDEELAPLNEAYYALRIPCPFLEDDTCSIYDERPSACRELLVTSPPAYCDDLVNNPVEALPIPIRVGTVLGLLWSELTATPPRMIPLPVVYEWAERHQSDHGRTWEGSLLLDVALDKIWWFLSQTQDVSQRQAASRPVSRTSGVQQ